MSRETSPGRHGDGDTLEDPTVEFEYQLGQWDLEKPVYVHTTARETHGASALKFQESYTYSGGLGQVVLQKVQAEPGLAPERNGSGDLVFIGDELQYVDTGSANRWVGTGRTILDNKGNPVKQYEPFFDTIQDYTDELELVEWGVTPFLHYDPLGRLLRTDLPDGTFTTIAFTPWEQTIHDANDNVLASDWWAERDALMSGPPENDGEIFAKEKCESHDSTPTRVLFDNLGRPFVTIAHNGLDGLAQPILFVIHVTLDIEGNPLVVTDALGIATETDTFAPGGLQLKTSSPDAGDRWALPNALGNPFRHWDSRSNVRRWTYDDLNRPTHAYLKHGSDDEKLQTRTLYGESLGVTAPNTNHVGTVYRVYDSAGVLTSVEYDFKGNLLESERRLAEDYRGAPDWIDLAAETDPATIETAADSLLEAEAFTTSWTFDALGRPVTQTTPDASLTTQTFGAGGLLQSVAVNIRGAVDPTDIVTNIDYNARGQRTRIEYGNDSETNYDYDPRTFRVRRIHTVRPNPDPDVQDLHYHYDPSGNIAMIRDEAQQGVFFDNAYVDATQKFYYDPTYRLIKARGRELASLTLPTPEGFVSIPHPQSGANTQRRYTQRYTYDAVGNITSMVHSSGGVVAWKRGYDYHPTDDDPPSPQISNRLRATSAASDDFEDPPNYTDVYEYDEHGNMTKMMPTLASLTWDDDDRLQATLHGDGGKTYYVYDGGGERVRKVRVNLAETTSKERLYFGPWETYRERHNINTTPILDLERETLHVHDDTGRVCLIETKTVDDGDPVVDPANIARYQYSNHLGTATLELDADAEVISYEEFHPYGTSSYTASNEAIEASPRRYRYTGKERDSETGLAYHGARYYACWIARWISTDPLGLNDDPARYSYTSGNPTSWIDPNGQAKTTLSSSIAPTVQPPSQPQPSPAAMTRGYSGAEALLDRTAIRDERFSQGVVVIGTEDDVKHLRAWLDEVATTQIGQQLIADIDASGKEVVIAFSQDLTISSGGHTYILDPSGKPRDPDLKDMGVKHDSLIRIYKHKDMSYGDIEKGVLTVNGQGFQIDLDAPTLIAHELAHARDYATGKWFDQDQKQTLKDLNNASGVWEKQQVLNRIPEAEEVQATKVENLFRTQRRAIENRGKALRFAPEQRALDHAGTVRPEFLKYKYK